MLLLASPRQISCFLAGSYRSTIRVPMGNDPESKMLLAVLSHLDGVSGFRRLCSAPVLSGGQHVRQAGTGEHITRKRLASGRHRRLGGDCQDYAARAPSSSTGDLYISPWADGTGRSRVRSTC